MVAGLPPSEIEQLNRKWPLTEVILERILAMLAGEACSCPRGKCVDGMAPSPQISLDPTTERLIQAGKLKSSRECPYHLFDRVLLSYELNNSRADDLDYERRRRETHRQLKQAVRVAASAIADGVRRAGSDRSHAAEERNNSHELPSKLHYGDPDDRFFWRVLSLHEELEKLAHELDSKTSRKSGPRGKTHEQSVIEGFLRGWETLNGKMPNSGNSAFQQHLIAACEFLGLAGPKDPRSAIRSVRNRLIASPR